MDRNFASRRLAPILLLPVALCMWLNSAQAGEEIPYEKMMAEKSPALVTVKFILKVNAPGQEAEQGEAESAGLMIDPKGLILCSNTYMGGYMTAMAHMMGGRRRDMMENVSMTPTDLKVLVGEDTEGLEAKLVARDSDLDLAWVQVKDPGDKKFAFVDFSKGTVPKIGDVLILIDRMEKGYDRAPSFTDIRLSAILKKPRDLYAPTLGFPKYGVPVFSANGQPVGFTILQIPDDEGSGENPIAMMTSMFSRQEEMGGLILPAAEVVKATQRALQGGGDKKEDKKGEGAEKKAEKKPESKEEKKDEPKK